MSPYAPEFKPLCVVQPLHMSIFLTALIHTVLACNTATGTNNTTGQETCRTEHSSCVFTSAPQLYRLPAWLIVSITVTNMLSALISKDEQQCVGAASALFVGEKKKNLCVENCPPEAAKSESVALFQHRLVFAAQCERQGKGIQHI